VKTKLIILNLFFVNSYGYSIDSGIRYMHSVILITYEV